LTEEMLLEYGVIETLHDLRSEGKVRFIGSSSTLPNIVEHLGMGVFDEFQIPYSALKREHEEVIARCATAGAGTVIRGGVSQGAPGDGHGIDATWSTFTGAKLGELCEEGESRSAFVLRFTLAHPDIHTVIVGTTSPAHLEENMETARRGPLPPDIYAEAKRRLDVRTTWNR
jgi:aryl-alcohol dehydrogenase-like predicted oxidoreductase